MYLMLVFQFPFNGDSLGELYAEIKAGVFDITSASWENISFEAKEMLTSML
jgi:serine/threonine protein kinase